MKKLILFYLIAYSFSSYSNADVSLISNKDVHTESTSSKETRHKKLPMKVIKPQIIKQLHIDGYIDSNYVRLIVDIVNGKKLTGYLFEQTDSKKYVYGEKINGVLHLYDPNGRHLTVVLDR